MRTRQFAAKMLLITNGLTISAWMRIMFALIVMQYVVASLLGSVVSADLTQKRTGVDDGAR
jgi:hypothetical protein